MFTVKRSAGVFTILLIFFFANLIFYAEEMPLYHEEPRRAIIAQEMLLSHNYITPTVCRENYLKKPPFHNWIILLEGKITGNITNLETRLPSIIAFLLTAIFIFLVFKEGEKGFIASLIFLTSFITLFSYANKGEPDMVFTFLTFMSYYFYIKSEKLPYFLTSAIFMGFSIMTKGISPFFFYPGFALYYTFNNRSLKKILRLFVHFLISAIIPFFWLWLYSRESGLNPLIHMFSKEISMRMIGSPIQIISHIVLFPLRVILALFPWSIVFIFTFNKRLIKTIWREKLFATAFYIVIVAFVFMTVFPGGRGRYFMPAVPFFSIVLSYFCPKAIPLQDKLKFAGFVLLFVLYSMFSFYLFKEGFVYHSTLLFVTALSIFYFFKKRFFVFDFLVVFSIFLFLLYIHGLYFYRANTKVKCNRFAKQISEIIKTDNYPVLIDNTLKPEFISIALNLERVTGEFVYSSRVFKNFSSYYLLTSKTNLKNCKLLLKFNCSKKVPSLYLFECNNTAK